MVAWYIGKWWNNCTQRLADEDLKMSKLMVLFLSLGRVMMMATMNVHNNDTHNNDDDEKLMKRKERNF